MIRLPVRNSIRLGGCGDQAHQLRHAVRTEARLHAADTTITRVVFADGTATEVALRYVARPGDEGPDPRDTPSVPSAVMRKTVSNDGILAALIEFVQVSDDLRATAYSALERRHAWPSVTLPISRFKQPFGDTVWKIAQQHGDPTRVYRWATCPNGKKHAALSQIYSTIPERLTGECADCDAYRARREAELATLPTFAEAHPYAVQWLADPADATSKQKLVTFHCDRCGDTNVRWRPSPDSSPRCHYCRTVGDAQPGDLIPRKGCGDHVKLEHDLAVALATEHGLRCVTDQGVVIRKRAIMIDGSFGDKPYPLPAVKPDLALPDRRVAIELDFDGRYLSHSHPREVRQDRERDAALAEVGWRVLRLREPDAPTDGAWPWKVVTTSRSPKRLAGLVADALGGDAPRSSDTTTAATGSVHGRAIDRSRSWA
jgi:hypothetical protein